MNVNSSDCMNSHSDTNSSGCMNSHNDINLSKYMNSYNDNNDMNSSDHENSYALPSVFVPGEELDGLTNGHDKSNTLDNTSEMNIGANCIDIDHTIQICTVPTHMI